MFLYEGVGVTVASLGPALTPQNRNRVSSATVVTSFNRDAAVGSLGTLLEDQMIFGGTGFLFTGGAFKAGFEEWILRPDTAYLFRITNVSGGAQPLGASLVFYEPN